MILIWKLWKPNCSELCTAGITMGKGKELDCFEKYNCSWSALLVSKHLAPLGLWTSRRGYRGRAKFTAPSFLDAALTAQLSFLQLIVQGHNVSAADARQQHNQSSNWSPETFPHDWLSGEWEILSMSLQTENPFQLDVASNDQLDQ